MVSSATVGWPRGRRANSNSTACCTTMCEPGGKPKLSGSHPILLRHDKFNRGLGPSVHHMTISALPQGASMGSPWPRIAWLKALWAAVLAMALGGCLDGGTIQASKISGTRVISQKDYRIGAGDALKIFVWRNEDLSTQVVVRPVGKISMPLVNDMVAAGKTPSELTEDLTRVLSEYVRNPKVNVIVTS